MKKSTKAVLLSALVAPGLGHIFLKKYFFGLVLLSISGLSIYHIASTIIETALQVVEQVQLGQISPDANSVMELVRQRTSNANDSRIDQATFILILCWFVGVIHSYRLGRALDKKTDDQGLV